MPPEPRVLIAGCGRIGTRLGRELAARGAGVWGLRRSPEPLPPPLRPLRADLTDPATLENRLPEALDLVYFIATPGRYADEPYRHTYVEGLTHLVEALRNANQHPRLVLVSSTAVYGQGGGEWVNEDSPTEPEGFSGRRILEAEGIARASGLPATVVRFGGIYGPGRTRLLRRLREGAPCQADPPLYTNRIHEDDCVGVLAHAGRLREPAPVYLAVDDAPCPQCELMDWLAGRLGLPRPARVPAAAERDRRSGGKRCRNDRLKASGYAFRHPTYREGYRAVLDDWIEH